MKRATLAVVSTIAALVLLLSFKTHSLSGTTNRPAAIATTGTTSGSTSSRSATYTGDAADTRYGAVQVQITVRNGRVTDVQAVEFPQNDPRDAQINGYAIPALDSEATDAGSASIDMISGATFTSEGYLTSLQSALDKAGI